MNQPEQNPLEIQVDHALAEYMSECDSGVIPNRESFIAKQPFELRLHLRELLSAADWIEQLAGPRLGDQATGGSAQFAANPSETGPDSKLAAPDPNDDTLPYRFTAENATDRTLPLSLQLDAGADGRHPQGLGLVGGPGTRRTASSTREHSQPVLPCQFCDYILERVLGRGGMGVVYAGRQRHLDRPVAVKMIRSGALASQEEVQRFYAEARSAARLDHPNIVTVYQCGEHDGHHYFSMDYVPGTDLARMIKDGPLPPVRAAGYVRDVARAIQYAHANGVLHRDLKPANVLVDENDMVRITDFGLAKQIGQETGLTATGAALGTPSYMSPEQASGRVDEQHHATDIYSLGAILFTIVTGQPPFKAGSVVQTIMQVIHRPAPRARTLQPAVDEDLETIIDVCLQKSPERRYASASALAEELDRYLAGVPIQARPMSTLRRSWYWLLGVPIFGAILDHRVVEPTDAHRWVQRGLISAGVLMLAAWMLLLIPSSVWYKNRMPRSIHMAAGASGGTYDRISKQLCAALALASGSEAIAVLSSGSGENLELLTAGEVELAMLQGDAVGAASVAVVAPLYYETVHVLATINSQIESLSDLAGKRVILGVEKAGSRSVASVLLEHAGVRLADLEVTNSNWQEMASIQDADAAIIVSRLESPELVELLSSGKFRILPIPDAIEFALEEPVFHPKKIPASAYPNCNIPEAGIATVATAAYLATREDCPDVLIQQVLECLYAPENVESTGILPAERAAHWQGLVWHPAARKYFLRYRH